MGRRSKTRGRHSSASGRASGGTRGGKDGPKRNSIPSAIRTFTGTGSNGVRLGGDGNRHSRRGRGGGSYNTVPFDYNGVDKSQRYAPLDNRDVVLPYGETIDPFQKEGRELHVQRVSEGSTEDSGAGVGIGFMEEKEEEKRNDKDMGAGVGFLNHELEGLVEEEEEEEEEEEDEFMPNEPTVGPGSGDWEYKPPNEDTYEFSDLKNAIDIDTLAAKSIMNRVDLGKCFVPEMDDIVIKDEYGEEWARFPVKEKDQGTIPTTTTTIPFIPSFLPHKEKGGGKFSNVASDLRQVNTMVRKFVINEQGTELAFPPLHRVIRKQLHQLCELYGLESSSSGSGRHRFVTVRTTPYTSLAESREVEKMIQDIQRKAPPKTQMTRAERRAARLQKKKGKMMRGEIEVPSDLREAPVKAKAVMGRGNRVVDIIEPVGNVAENAPPISSDNIGHQLLSRMGWDGSNGLGSSNQGVTEPVSVVLKRNRHGLGHD